MWYKNEGKGTKQKVKNSKLKWNSPERLVGTIDRAQVEAACARRTPPKSSR
jgi:hypothetical protein